MEYLIQTIFSGDPSELVLNNASCTENAPILSHHSLLITKQRPNKFPTQNATTRRRQLSSFYCRLVSLNTYAPYGGIAEHNIRDHWGDLGVDGWIILGWISRRWDVGMWTGLGWPRIGTGGVRL